MPTPADELREITERTTIRARIAAGERRVEQLTDTIFFIRHPDRVGTQLGDGDHDLVREWKAIRNKVVAPELMTGQLPLVQHTVETNRTALRDRAVISPFAHCTRGVRDPDKTTNKPKWIVVHCTGPGPAESSEETHFEDPAIDFALKFYLRDDKKAVYPHYVIDFNGAIHATCSEDQRGRHAGWKPIGGAAFWKTFSAPEWWTKAWAPATSPLDLLPDGLDAPNDDSIGIELMIHHRSYTIDQYRGLGVLIADIATRYPHIRLDGAPRKKLLVGHEDLHPLRRHEGDPEDGGRADDGGGWDPGAHREDPFFDWSLAWREIEKNLRR